MEIYRKEGKAFICEVCERTLAPREECLNLDGQYSGAQTELLALPHTSYGQHLCLTCCERIYREMKGEYES